MNTEFKMVPILPTQAMLDAAFGKVGGEFYKAALAAASASQHPEQPIHEEFVSACDKFDWTPDEALRFYAEGKHFDTVDGRTRILCTGAIASYALKNSNAEHAEMKGAEAPQAAQPIMLTAVGELVDDGDGGLEASWILEGGTSELFAGMLLLVADNEPELCAEDGSAEVYTHADSGEVERLKAELGHLRKWEATIRENSPLVIRMESAEQERDTLRAQLAELRTAAKDCADTLYCQSSDGADALEVLREILSTTAKPEADKPIGFGMEEGGQVK